MLFPQEFLLWPNSQALSVVCDKEMASFATKEKRKGDPYHNHDNFSTLGKKENFSSGTSSSFGGDYNEFLVLFFILYASRILIIKRLFSHEAIPPISKLMQNKSLSMAENKKKFLSGRGLLSRWNYQNYSINDIQAVASFLFIRKKIRTRRQEEW